MTFCTQVQANIVSCNCSLQGCLDTLSLHKRSLRTKYNSLFVVVLTNIRQLTDGLRYEFTVIFLEESLSVSLNNSCLPVLGLLNTFFGV